MTQVKRRNYARYFEERKRIDDGKTFMFTKCGSPEDLLTLIKDIHKQFDLLPCDWIYATILSAFEFYDDEWENCGTVDDILMENFIESEDMLYNHYFLKWLHCEGLVSLVDEAVEGCGYPGDLIAAIRAGYFLGVKRIGHAVFEFINEQEYPQQ